MNAQDMEQIISGITNGNGYISYIFREQSNSPKKRESSINLSVALSQNNINDCHLISNEKRRNTIYNDIKKRLSISTAAKSPISTSPESTKSPYRDMTSCEIPNMDIWGGVLVDSSFSQRLRNKASSVMESGGNGLGNSMINNSRLTNNTDFYSTSEINRTSSRLAANRHLLRLNTNVSKSPNIINSALEDRNQINPRYYSIININRTGSINNSEETIQDSKDGISLMKSPLTSINKMNDESVYSSTPNVKQNTKIGMEKIKEDNKPLQASTSNMASGTFNKKKNKIENSPLNSGQSLSPLNPNYVNLSPTKKAISAVSIPVTLNSQPNQPSNLGRNNTPNSPIPISNETRKISISVSAGTPKSPLSPEIFSDSFESNNEPNSPVDGSIPNFEEIEQWHLIHKPSKTIRSTRLSFNKSTATTKPPYNLFQNLCWALYEMKNVYPNRFYFVRNPDFYLFECHLLTEDLNSICVKFEVEVCKVWLLKLYALRLKRITGNPFTYEELYSELMSLLKTDEEIMSSDMSQHESKKATVSPV